MAFERNLWSTEYSCDTFATDAFFSPEDFFDNNTFPGACANRRFDVIMSNSPARAGLLKKTVLARSAAGNNHDYLPLPPLALRFEYASADKPYLFNRS